MLWFLCDCCIVSQQHSCLSLATTLTTVRTFGHWGVVYTRWHFCKIVLRKVRIWQSFPIINKIPEDNPYGEGLVELIDRMLTVDCKARADMTEVILCLSAIYSGRPLPPRKKIPKSKKSDGEGTDSNPENDRPRGTYRTDGQGIRKPKAEQPRKPVEVSCL